MMTFTKLLFVVVGSIVYWFFGYAFAWGEGDFDLRNIVLKIKDIIKL
jgi:hypothetical protein